MRRASPDRDGRHKAGHDAGGRSGVQLFIEITPSRVHLKDQVRLPNPWPTLDRCLALNGICNARIAFVINEPINPVTPSMIAAVSGFMLPYTPREIIGNTHIESATGSACEDIDVIHFHKLKLSYFLERHKRSSSPPRHGRPCAGHPDAEERRAFPIGITGTRPVMTSRVGLRRWITVTPDHPPTAPRHAPPTRRRVHRRGPSPRNPSVESYRPSGTRSGPRHARGRRR
ncbi:hypothetical protein MicloDRAFT_00053550 [Microvirga lotononidis]|uniref:Uncharacterized protein n=1 Tax=Microvirga lotononidis TaxID=864069 RepID=I4YKZ8_9HYPH|nr:hypothetical protein MicloDRAFT_00053550 [Microvirga lotononidis]